MHRRLAYREARSELGKGWLRWAGYVCGGGGKRLAHVAGRNTELGTGSASSQTPSFLHIQCFSSHGEVENNCICVPVVPSPHPVMAWDGSKQSTAEMTLPESGSTGHAQVALPADAWNRYFTQLRTWLKAGGVAQGYLCGDWGAVESQLKGAVLCH